MSISFFEENLKDIDALITAEMVSGKGRVNRSDVVRAAVEATCVCIFLLLSACYAPVGMIYGKI
ncbi:ribbon-helix-helix domain-containing protein, partial [Escherichia coli]|uniref:ribbon-helix-helix domain-containing protein n=1 Tax=Escherichia coli TaxID=562 RepID=UPI0021E8975E